MKNLDAEFKISSAQVGYMKRWLEFQQINGGFIGRDVETVEAFITSIKQCERWRDLIYKRKRKFKELQGLAANPNVKNVTSKDVRTSLGEMLVFMMNIGLVWEGFYKDQTTFPLMPSSRQKKDREMEEILGFEYNPEKFG
jgi:hypothetical protein